MIAKERGIKPGSPEFYAMNNRSNEKSNNGGNGNNEYIPKSW